MPVYEEQFRAAGLAYLTVGGRGYYTRPEIRDLTALLTALYSPGDDLNLAIALRSPLFSLSDETLYRLRWRLPDGSRSPDPIPYRNALKDPPPTGQMGSVTFAAQVMKELWNLTGRAEVWEILRTALDRTGFEAALTLNDGGLGGAGRKRSNVQKFMELARSQGGADLSRFLESLEDLRTREAREGEALGSAPESGAVQLMSIHAAKGLEFPVVAVADLGRRRIKKGETDRILSDPAFGLVCQFLGEDGRWQTPAGYAWASWLNDQMDTAENKRLLYVACTRAADLLILSGNAETKDTWMDKICQAWQIPGNGPHEELVEKDGFCLHIQRPAYTDPGSVSAPAVKIVSKMETVPLDVPVLPLLARPLTLPSQRSLAVTHMSNALTRDVGATLNIRPAARRCSETVPSDSCPPRAPAYLVGKLVHRALTNWDCLALPAVALNHQLKIFARREGIFEHQALEDAIGRARRMLHHLMHSPLYGEINQAIRRMHEVPLTLETHIGILHGILDLLYLDQGGIWHVLEWKTEWIHPEEIEAKAHDNAFQMAAYVEAIRRLMKVEPVASVCFLPGGVKLYTFSMDELKRLSKK
jgi:ATP-dependent exoDNAse (exonuclease V) beta subunit